MDFVLTHSLLHQTVHDPPQISWHFFEIFQSKRRHKNKPYAQTQDQVSRLHLFKVQQMNGRIFKKHQQKELNSMRVTFTKTRNYIFLCCVRSGEKIE